MLQQTRPGLITHGFRSIYLILYKKKIVYQKYFRFCTIYDIDCKHVCTNCSDVSIEAQYDFYQQVLHKLFEFMHLKCCFKKVEMIILKYLIKYSIFFHLTYFNI